MSNKEAQVDWDDDREPICLGDYVQSTENRGIIYIVIGLHTCNNQARVRTVPRYEVTYEADGWCILLENVYICDLDILEKIG